MFRLRRLRLAFVGFVIGAGLLLSANPAAAATGAGGGVFTGSGTWSPGVGVSAAPQSLTMSGSLTGSGVWNNTPTAVNDTCSFSGSGVESVAEGSGTLSGSCSGSASITANLGYTRVGSTLVGNGTATVNGFSTTIVIVCIVVVVVAPPWIFFEIVCWIYIN